MKPLIYIFDLDGTLVDTRIDITNAINDMLSRYSIPSKSVDEVTSYVGDGFIPLIERCLLGSLPNVKGLNISIDEALNIFRKAYEKRLVEHTTLYPGIKELLHRIKFSVKSLLAVLTNKDVEYADEILNKLGIKDYFSEIVGGNSLPRKKPSPDGVFYILRKIGVEKKDSLLIGDGKNDILTAKNAGVKSVFVRWGFRNENHLHIKPDYIVSNPLEILDISI